MYETLILFIILGFIAQMIDGALGMAYGVSLTTFLLSTGIPPATASASVHTAEIFTTGASGISHLKLGNVNKELFTKLLVPGMIGGIVGAYILTSIPVKIIKPFVALYLLLMGVIILRKTFKKIEETTTPRAKLFPLGLIGGFFDALGGGGWGPIVTSTLVARGHNPRFTIGTVNLAEFFVTLTEVATFLMIMGLAQLQIILGLIIGGVIAAPLAAYVCKKIPSKKLMIIVGILIITLSVKTIYQTML